MTLIMNVFQEDGTIIPKPELSLIGPSGLILMVFSFIMGGLGGGIIPVINGAHSSFHQILRNKVSFFPS